MPLIRLTQKLQKEIGLKSVDLIVDPNAREPFTEWYSHIFVLARRKHLIFVETQTLFTFSVVNITRDDLRKRLQKLFEKGLSKALFIEGASSQVMSKIMDVCRRELRYAKAENRRTIGAMNEFIKQHKFGFSYYGRTADILDRFNRYMPMRGFPNDAKDYQFPIDVFAQKLKREFHLVFVPEKEDLFKKLLSRKDFAHEI